MTQLQSNGITLEYDTFGEPDAEPVLLIMGLGIQMTGWAPEFCEALARQGYYVIRFDNRDIGLSTKFDHLPTPGRLRFFASLALKLPLRAPYALADMADDAAGLLDALELESAHIVGASMGGMIAQLVAYRHPERTRSLTSLMSSSGDRRLPAADRDVAQHIFFTRPPAHDRDLLIRHMVRSRSIIASPAYPRSDEDWRDIVVASLERSFYPQGFGRQLAAVIADGSRVRRLARIRVPTLVVHGSHDPLVPVEHGVDTASHIPGARLEIIDGMGHDLPPQLDETLTSLIAEHARSATSQRGE